MTAYIRQLNAFFKPKPTTIIKIPEKERAYIQQGYIGSYVYHGQLTHYLASSGIGPCVAVIFYDARLKHAIFAHLDSRILPFEYQQYKIYQHTIKKSLPAKSLLYYQPPIKFNKILSEEKNLQKILQAMLKMMQEERTKQTLSYSGKFHAYVVYTNYHDSNKQIGFPLKDMLEKTFKKLLITPKEILAKPRGNHEDVLIDVNTGQVKRYCEMNDKAIEGDPIALNHPGNLNYFAITENGELESCKLK